MHQNNKQAFYTLYCQKYCKDLSDALLKVVHSVPLGNRIENQQTPWIEFLQQRKLFNKSWQLEPTLSFFSYITSQLYKKCKKLTLKQAQDELHQELSAKLQKDFVAYLMQQKSPDCLS